MLLTQEYEGRDQDITIMPWRGELSIISAFMSLIQNNDGARFIEITEAAMRETWPKVSRIRAHCGVEVALDNCVQRLRKRITMENYNKRISQESSVKGLDRTPSFYTSRSIVNLSGLSVADPVPRLNNKGSQKLLRNLSNNSLGSSGRNSLGTGGC
jgi:hypothetical protein